MSRPQIVFAGACIVEALLRHFRTIPGLADKVDFHVSQVLPDGRPTVPVSILARATVLLEEAAPWQGRGTLSATERSELAVSCRTVTIPTLHFNSLWPLMVEDPRNTCEPDRPWGSIPFGMGDRLALKIVQSVTDPVARRAAYEAIEFRKTINLARTHELESRDCFAREQGCDVRVAAYVTTNFREKRLYYTHAHPTGDLLCFVLAQLFAIPEIRDLIRLPYDTLILGARQWAKATTVFRGEEAPIHPAVAEHFGLTWWRKGLTYSWMGNTRTFSEWIDWYLTYVPNESAGARESAAAIARDAPALQTEFSAGPWLNGLILAGSASTVVTLDPTREITRTTFTVSSPIDTAVARFGNLFHDFTFLTYDTGDTKVCSLNAGSVVGCDGIVLHRGQVLSDTLRHVIAGSAAPAILEMTPNGIRLQPGLTTRHLAGRYMVGYNGMWRSYGHWLFEALPRLMAFLEARKAAPDLQLLLPPLEDQSVQAQTLEILGIDADAFRVVVPNEVLTCDELYVTNAFDLWMFSPYCATAARELARIVEPELDAEEERPVFIHRRSGPRLLKNFDSLADELSMRGFITLDVEAMSIRQTIARLRAAPLVVGEHGDELASLLFCRPGTQVLELFNPACLQPLFWSLSSCMNLRYGFLVGNHAYSESAPEPNWNSDYEIPPDALRMALDAVGSPQ